MKFIITTLILFVFYHSEAQIICIKCFDQKETISPNATNSILNGNGIVSSVITDIFGNPRNNPPDIGAIEVN